MIKVRMLGKTEDLDFRDSTTKLCAYYAGHQRAWYDHEVFQRVSLEKAIAIINAKHLRACTGSGSSFQWL